MPLGLTAVRRTREHTSRRSRPIGRGLITALLSLAALVAFAATSSAAAKIDPRVRAALGRARLGLVSLEGAPSGAALNANGELDVFIRGNVDRAQLEALGVTVRTMIPGICTAYIPTAALESVANLQGVTDIRGAAPVDAELSASVPATGADVLRTAGPAFTGYNGAGVLVGDVDSGIDFDHGDFKNVGGLTRLVTIWDQTVAGVPPLGYAYGTEWTAAQIDGGLCTEVDNTSGGHGTHVMGIAGGDGSQTGGAVPAHTFVGMAPQADLCMVKTNFQTTGVFDGVAYIMDLATSRGQNAAVNLSLGSHFGSHDGTSAFEAGLSALTGPGKIIAKSAGNERGIAQHAEVFAAGAGTSATMLISSSTTVGRAIAIDGYYESTENLNVRITTPNGTVIGPIPLGGVNGAYPGTSAGTNGMVYIENGLALSGGGDPEVYIELNQTAAGQNFSGTWTFTFIPVALGAANGEVDLWRFFVNVGTANFVIGNQATEELVSEPGNAVELITTAAWIARRNWTDCNGLNLAFSGAPLNGNLATFSSPGPTRDGRQKPDIAAPGSAIGSTRSFDLVIACAPGGSTLLNDAGNHIVNQGTSMAAPHTTGAAALLMQKYGAMTPAQVKTYLNSHAIVDGFTGAPWNKDWGNGKLHLGDLVDPVVTVTSPNGGETLGLCANATLTWTATDAVGTITSVDLQLSRSGPGGPFEDIALAIPNTGTYNWIVTGPATANAYLKVTARDANNNTASDLSDAAFAIDLQASSVVLAANPAKSFFGEDVTLTATMSPASATGSVEFYDGATLIATENVNPMGVATTTASGLTIGSHSLTANYLGDACFAPSTFKVLHEVNLGQSVTGLTASAPKIMCGEKLTLTATVTLDTSPDHLLLGLENAPGAVQFFDDGNPIGMPVVVDGNGVATISLLGLTGGIHQFTASYSGDKEKGPSSSDPVQGEVSPLPSTTVLAVSPNPAKGLGDLVTLTATLTPNDAGGSVEFFDGLTSLGVVPVTGGVATLSLKFADAGDHTITASYSGTDCLTDSGDDELLTILGAPTLSIGDATVTEGNSGQTQAQFVVSLSSPINQKVTVDFTTLDGTATKANSDYDSTGGTLSIAAGETSATITVNVNGDVKFEGDETFTVVLSNASKATIGDGVGDGVILNDDTTPTVSIADLSTTEGSTGGTKQFKFLVTLSNPTDQVVSVNYQTSDGSATLANNDYVAGSGTFNIPAKSDGDTLRILVTADTNRESDETFSVALSGAVNATIADGNATGTILNDDGVPQILHTGVRVAEGHPGLTNIVLTVSLSNPTDVPVTVNWATADSNATLANNDYLPASGQVTIPAKQLSTTLVVQAVGDSTNEDWEVFHVLLSNPVNATLGARPWLRVELSNDDTAPVVYIGDVTQLEGDAGTTAFTFRVWLSRGTTFGTPTVTYTTQNGTATTGDNDYNFATGNVVFGPKEREKFVTVFVNGDVNFEPDETFTVKLSNPRFGMGPIGDGTGVGTILNDDPKGCPEVTALTPDPNVVVVGGIAKLGWVANGTDNPVTSIDLFISRDSGTSWEILSLGETNDGTYTWNPVTMPGTNSGITPVFSARLKVVAYDAPGCSTVAVSGPFAIYNAVTDVLVAQFQANPAGGGVEVRWELAAGLAVESVELERSSSLDGPWEVIAADRRNDGNTVVALDRSASSGTTYYYRLALGIQGGNVVRVGPLTVEAGGSIATFTLGNISPNPSRGMTRIDYALPRESSVRLSVVDVAGREVAVLASGSKGAGSHQAVWSGETDRGRAPAGLYFIRYQAAGVNFVRRLVLTR